MVKRLLVISLILLGGAVFAEEPDSSDIKTDHSGDSLFLPHDSLAPADTLNEAQKAEALFMERYKKYKRELKKAAEPQFSYFDSLKVYFTSPRLNLRSQIDRSFYHDAGDYFRFDPGYFVLESQNTPVRKTVQPFGMTGDRLNILVNGHQLKPFEHVPEPDGLIDLNDIPTALDHEVYILPGPAGALLGGEQMVATLLTFPEKKDTVETKSTFLVDKGTFGYSYARGRFSKKFVRGRTIDMSIGYRNADGAFYGSGDDAYHYYGDFYFPFRETYGLKVTGQLYRRTGNLWYRPELGGGYIERDRFDRTARLSLFSMNEPRTRKFEIAYEHNRQGSDINRYYRGRFNLTGHALTATREWVRDNYLFKTVLSGNYQEYDDGYDKFRRYYASTAFNIARLAKGWRYAFQAGARQVEEFGLLPFAAGLFFRDSDRWLFMFSGGFNNRAPSLMELNLRRQAVSLYRQFTGDYTDEGNKGLLTEKQLVGNATLQWGSTDNNLGLSVTGGRIFDGIDWHYTLSSDKISLAFKPVNGDINFVNTTLSAKMRLKDFICFYGGAAYHFLDYDKFEDRAYTPEYQAFSGMELHLFWSRKLIDLFAYGEMVYVGPYDGYVQRDIGNVVLNAKLSFRMGSFRFHYVIQNVVATQYNARDFYVFLGRYGYYGFTWDFID
ncbi:MAG: TonB-dependent receptor plug domain-containing protein [candidate division Zixibacteria bacterium]|nr:TonB-dependent receptor plug domain-containing protein [candidate division Zixibacteria bacterium]